LTCCSNGRANGWRTVPDQTPGRSWPDETLGQRIGRLRALLGWTQQELAYRIAISRVAISHLEMGISVPSERTVVLLAGVFHLEPHELIDGTAYPAAKTERLPLVTARYTEVEFQVALMQRDLSWLARLDTSASTDLIRGCVHDGWQQMLRHLDHNTVDPGERRLLSEARITLAAYFGQFRHSARADRTV
jgi:transcriptional regulator with XRE-family HTH domain